MNFALCRFVDLIDERGPRYVCKKYTLAERDEILENLDIYNMDFLFRMGLTKEELMKLFSKGALQRRIRNSSFNTLMLTCDLLPVTIIEKEEFYQKFKELTYHRMCYYFTYYRATMKKFISENYLTEKLLCRVLSKSTLEQILHVGESNSYLIPMVKGLKKMVYHSLFPIRKGTGFRGKEEESILVSAQRAYCKGVIENIVSFIY
jgi:hypothetical protein